MAKSFLASKTFWTGVIIPVAVALIPGAAGWVQANPAAFTTIIGALFILLRIVTKSAVNLTPPSIADLKK